MAETVSSRRVKLTQLRSLIDQMIRINETGHQIETQMVAAGLSELEIESTLNKLFDSCGPLGWDPLTVGSPNALNFQDGILDSLFNLDNISCRVGNLMMTGVMVQGNDPIDWVAQAEPASA